MPIITDKLSIFAIHKTGTHWVRHAMREGGLTPRVPLSDGRATTHWTPAQTPDRMIGDRYKVTFVRNPIDWLSSWWCSRMKEKWSKLDAPHDDLRKCKSARFEKFVGRYLETLPGTVTRAFDAYTNGCDYVGKVENQPHALCEALVDAGENADWEAIKRTPIHNEADPVFKASCRWTPDMLSAVYLAESTAFSRYEYEPEAISYA